MKEKVKIIDDSPHFHKTWIMENLGLESKNVDKIKETLKLESTNAGYFPLSTLESFLKHLILQKSELKRTLEIEKISLENELLIIKRDKELGTLINKEEAALQFTSHIQELLSFLKMLPHTLPTQVNPTSPQTAKQVIIKHLNTYLKNLSQKKMEAGKMKDEMIKEIINGSGTSEEKLNKIKELI